MTIRSRILLALAALALLAVYVLPLWHITLDAPQYPEGLGMYIKINTVEGQNQGNLESINGLNHYIGMKPIVPESIPELKVLPWVFATLIGLGLLAAAVGRRWMLYLWVGTFALVMIGSLADFYRWGYDYGHNLDEARAIIKVPGMSYQPPLIGTKQMLNITASSWPAVGGCIAALSFAAGCGLVIAEARRSRRAKDERRLAGDRHHNSSLNRASVPAHVAAFLSAGLLIAGCTPGPEPIHYGHESCAHCRMTISDQRFGAELVTTTGKVYTFDSIECLAAFYAADAAVQEKTHSLWVTDYRTPSTLINAAEAAFVRSAALSSPMGANLAAVSNDDAEAARDELNGLLLSWTEVLNLTPSQHAQPASIPHGAAMHE